VPITAVFILSFSSFDDRSSFFFFFSFESFLCAPVSRFESNKRAIKEQNIGSFHTSQKLPSDLTNRRSAGVPDLVQRSRPVIGKYAVSPFLISETAQTAKIYWFGPARVRVFVLVSLSHLFQGLGAIKEEDTGSFHASQKRPG
jgi:hypothetical protein